MKIRLERESGSRHPALIWVACLLFLVVPFRNQTSAALADRDVLKLAEVEDALRKLSPAQTDTADSLISNLESRRERERAFSVWVDRCSTVDPIAALSFLDDPRNVFNSTVRMYPVLRRACGKDLQRVQEKVLAAKPVTRRDRYCSTVASYMSESDPKAAIEWLLKLDGKGIHPSDATQSPTARMAKSDPATAANYALKFTNRASRTRAFGSALNVWLTKDAAAALQAVEKLDDRELRNLSFHQLIRFTGRTDPKQAMAISERLDGQDRIEAMHTVLGMWNDKDSAAATVWVEQVKDLSLRGKLVNMSAHDLADKEPRRVADMAVKLPVGSYRSSALFYTLDEWSENDPSIAMDYAMTLKRTTERLKYAKVIFKNSLSGHRAEASAILNKVTPIPIRHQLVLDAANDWLIRDTKTAIKWMHTNLDEGQRVTIARKTSSFYLNDGFASVAEFIRSLPDTERMKPTVALADAWFRRDSDQAAKWLEGLEPGPLREEALRSASSSLAIQNTELATTLARQIADIGKQARLFGLIANRAMNKPDQGMAWLKTLPAGTNHFSATVSGMSVLGSKEPLRAFEFVRALPGDELRRRAMGSLAGAWAYKEPERAFNAFVGLNHGAPRTYAIRIALSRWVKHDAEGAAAMLGTITPAATRTEAIKSFVDAARREHPKLAAQWLLRLDPADMESEARELTLRLLAVDRTAGKTFLEKLPDPLRKRVTELAQRRRLLPPSK